MENKEVVSLLENAKATITNLAIALESKTKDNKELIGVVKEQKEELITYNKMTSQDDWFDMKEVAKILNYKGYGRNKIYELLRITEVLDKNNEPYQQQVNNGRFKIIIVQKEDHYNIVREFKVTFVSIKGLDFIRKLLSDITTD